MNKPCFKDYAAWSRGNLAFDPDDRALKSWVETNIRTFRSSVETHPCIVKLQQFVVENQATNLHKTHNIISQRLDINVKSFGSIISKCYRVNVLNNRAFSSKPLNGWLLPENILFNIKDLIRSTIVCRHINEPKRISEIIASFAAEEGIACKIDAQAKETGYYAYHVYLSIPVTILDRSWNTSENFMSFEIQVTTEMQHILYGLTHIFYEKERHEESTNDEVWKWNYKSSRFAASYISHSLHLLEGLVLRLYEDVSPSQSLSAVTTQVGQDETEIEQ